MDGETENFRIDIAIRRIASGQMGLVTRQQMEELGIHRCAITRRRSAGLLVPVLPSVMRLSDAPATALQMSLAAGLAVSDGVVTGPSAAVVDGLPVVAPQDPTVMVGGARSARRPGVAIVRALEVLPSRWWSGIRITTTTATIVSLPRFVTAEILEECLDHAITHRMTTADRVRSLAESLPRRSAPGRSWPGRSPRAARRAHRGPRASEQGRAEDRTLASSCGPGRMGRQLRRTRQRRHPRVRPRLGGTQGRPRDQPVPHPRLRTDAGA